MKQKLITDELINEMLEARGFGEKQINDDLVQEAVLNHFNVEFTDNFTSNADFYIYEESTADGYSVYVATHDTSSININENVYYYDSDLGDALEEFIKYSNGDEHTPEVIYVDDLHQHFIDDCMGQLFEYLAARFEEDIIDELKDKGYKQINEIRSNSISMADISMCEGDDCNLRETCYRFKAEPCEYRQSYMPAPIKNGVCEYYWSTL